MTDPTGAPFDLINSTQAERRIYFQGRHDGYMDGEAVGYARGWAASDEYAAPVHAAAYRVVQAMARLDPWDVHVAGIRRRQEEAAARHAANAEPWPDEDDPQAPWNTRQARSG